MPTPDPVNDARHMLRQLRKKQDRNPSWFSRWRRYPMSIIGHIGQGAAAGVAASYGHHWPAGIWSAGFLAYQFGSGARKWSIYGHPDTMGLDTMDYAIGFALGYGICHLVR